MSEPIFTSQLNTKEKSIDAADSKGRHIRKYQMPTIVEWAGFAISSDIDMAPRAK